MAVLFVGGLLLLTGCSRKVYPSETETTISNQWCFPLPGAKVISPYGQRGGRQHTGVDLKTKAKDKIYAAFDGEVVFSGKFHGYGNLVRIKHANGLEPRSVIYSSIPRTPSCTPVIAEIGLNVEPGAVRIIVALLYSGDVVSSRSIS